MSLLSIADATSFWTAVGAIGSMLAATSAVLIAFTLTRRQTDLTERAASNARVSAGAAVEAARIAREALEVSTNQLGIAQAELDLARSALDVSSEAARASVRPLFDRAELRWEAETWRFLFRAWNRGAGPGSIAEVALSGPGEPPSFVIEGAPTPVVGVGESVEAVLAAPAGLVEPPSGVYEVSGTTVAAKGNDFQHLRWRFDVAEPLAGVAVDGVLAAIAARRND